MNKQLRMAIVVEIIVLVIAFAFSIIYLQMGLYRTSHVLDVLLIVVWVLVAAVLLVVFRSRSLAREEMVRRFYLSSEWIYNHEIGYAPLSQIAPEHDPYQFVTFAADALAKMSYGFEVADAPDDFEPEYLISSRDFRFHLIDDDGDPKDAGVVIDQWKGVLMRVTKAADGSHSYEEIDSYENARELSQLIDSCGLIGLNDESEGYGL